MLGHQLQVFTELRGRWRAAAGALPIAIGAITNGIETWAEWLKQELKELKEN